MKFKFPIELLSRDVTLLKSISSSTLIRTGEKIGYQLD